MRCNSFSIGNAITVIEQKRLPMHRVQWQPKNSPVKNAQLVAWRSQKALNINENIPKI